MTRFVEGQSVKHRALNKVRIFSKNIIGIISNDGPIEYRDGIIGRGTSSDIVMNDIYIRSNIFAYFKPGMVTKNSHIKKIREYIRANKLNIKAGGVWSNKRLLINLINTRRLLNTYSKMFDKLVPIDKLVNICTCCLSNAVLFKHWQAECLDIITKLKRIESTYDAPDICKKNFITTYIRYMGEKQLDTTFIKQVLIKDFNHDDYIGMVIYDNDYDEQAMVIGYDINRASSMLVRYYGNDFDQIDDCYVTRKFVDQRICGFGDYVEFLDQDTDTDTDTDPQ